MNKRVLRTLINEQGLWEDEMLPTFQTITILVYLEGFGFCKAGPGGYSVAEPWSWGIFFSLPLDLTWESWSEGGLRGHQSPELLSHGCASRLRPRWGVSGSSVSTEATAGLPGFCYLPGGAEGLSSLEAHPASLVTHCLPAGAGQSLGPSIHRAAGDVLFPSLDIQVRKLRLREGKGPRS